MAYEDILHEQRRKLRDAVKACAWEAEQNEKSPRRGQNKKNWNYFHGIIDWSHKREDDPRIHLHKLGVAAERVKAKFKQGLMNYDKWVAVETEVFNPNAVVTEGIAKRMLTWAFECSDTKTVLSDATLCASLESRLALKLGGKYVAKPKFVSKSGKLVREDKKYWQPDLSYLLFEQYLRDTLDAKNPMFEIEMFVTDYYRVEDLASDEPTPEKPFRLEAVKKLSAYKARTQDEAIKTAEGSPQKDDQNKARKRVLIQNFFGTVLDESTGSVMMWKAENGEEYPLRNIFCVVANEEEVLVDPQPIRRYTGRAPFVAGDLMRSPGTGRKALLDAGVDLNEALNELFSLMLGGALKAVHNVTWYREDWIVNKKDVSGGIKDGSSIAIEGSAPQGEPMGVMHTGEVPQDAFMMFQALDRSFAENVISNQLDLSGALPGKEVRSTEVVTASSAISDVFDAMAADIEDSVIERLAVETFYDVIQHVDEIDPDVVKSWFADSESRGQAFMEMSPKDRFTEVDGVFKFKGKGLRGLMANAAKAQAAINYLSVMSANPLMIQQVESQISMAKIGLLIAKGLGFDQEEIAPDERERAMIEQRQQIREQMIAQAELEGQNPQSQASGTPRTGSLPSVAQPGQGQQSIK